MPDPRYPIGKFTYDGPPTPEQRQELLQHIEQAPGRLHAAVKGLSDQQLDTPYRPDGWTVRQVAHHVPMSLEKNLVLYAWHGRHHVAHITSLRERNGW